MTARLRAAQDEAYAESLAADQEKERKKEREREARDQLERDTLHRQMMEEQHRQQVTHFYISPTLEMSSS